MSPSVRQSIAVFFAVLLLARGSVLLADQLEAGLVGEFYSLGEPVVDFPSVSPHTVPTYRRVDETINFESTLKAFPGTDLLNQFYVRWRGQIRIPENAEYTFSLRSDDGSRLSINGRFVVDNGGLHPWVEKSGKIELETGLHNVEVEYFQNAVFSGCQLFWESSAISKSIVPADVLLHRTSVQSVHREAWFIPTESTYHPRLWASGEGLPHNSVSAVGQSRDGYLWVGTPKGLSRFDGVRFTPFPISPGDQLSSAGIRCVYETEEGSLWIGPEKGGLVEFKDGKFIDHDFPEDAQVRALLQDRDGALWIGTTKGLALRRNGQWTWFYTEEGLSGNVVLSLCRDRDRILWVGTNRGLCRSQGDKFVHVYGSDGETIRAICHDHENSLWFAKGGNGLVRFRNGEFHTFGKADGLPDEMVSVIYQDTRNELWVGTFGGLCRRSGERFVTEVNSEGTAYDTVHSLAEDSEGSIWLGTKEGLSQLRLKPFKSYTQRQGLSHNNIMSILEDRGGTLWMAAWGGGLSGLKNGQVTIYKRENSPLNDLLLSIHETRDGSLWLGSERNGGLFQFKDGKFTEFGSAQGLVDPAIRVILEDREQSLWIGTSSALYRMRNGKFERFTTVEGLSGNMIRALYEDKQGRLWIGTAEGLTLYQDGKFSSFTTENGLPSNQILSIYQDSQSTLWIGTDGGGLCRVANPPACTFTSYTSRQGLFSDTIYEILEDDRGYLWMSCFSGVFRIRGNDLNDLDRGSLAKIPCVSFGKAEGMSSVQCNGVAKPGGWKGKDGRLWFPTTRGVVVVDPTVIRDTKSLPPILIEQVLSDKANVPLLKNERAASLGRKPRPDETVQPFNHVTIPPGRGELEIHYTALSFRSSERNRFRYKLQGIDSDWVEADTRRVAYYNNLSPGEYTFHVTGSNSDGVWNQVGSTLQLRLQPHFWQTTWFLVFSAIAAVGLIGSGARYIAWRKMQFTLDRLEKQHAVEKERSRIARDMHDDIGVRLTELLLVGERAVQPKTGLEETKSLVRRTSQSIREVVDSMDAIVWAVNPQNDSLSRFVPYAREYIQNFLETTDIHFSLNIPVDLPDLPLSSEWRHNLYMVIREALNNAVKHSSATEVKFSLQIEKTTFIIEIADNGNGFAQQESSLFGNGLLNMRKRIASIHGHLDICSQTGIGTRIRIELPFPATPV